jgi:hypothetical protein
VYPLAAASTRACFAAEGGGNAKPQSRLGAAAAALNVTHHGSRTGRADAVIELAKQVTARAA